jgi:hypothetical protein
MRVDTRENSTTIYVSGWPDFESAANNRQSFLLDLSRPKLHETPSFDIYEGPSLGYFYRGVLVHRGKKPFKLTYNVKEHTMLTEDRTLKYSFLTDCSLMRTIAQSEAPEVIAEFLTNVEYGEAEINPLQYDGETSSVFLETVNQVLGSPRRGQVPKNYAEFYANKRKVEQIEEPIKLTPTEDKMLSDAKHMLSRNACPEIYECKIIPVSFLGNGVTGMMRKDTIYIAHRAFEMGLNHVVGTLFEEYCHLVMNFRDMDRDFQNYLIDRIGRMIVEKETGKKDKRD